MDKRKDVTPADKKEAEKKYGDVNYADETNKKYPLDTEEHVRAATSYWGMPKNKSKYSSEEQSKITARIEAAKKKFGIGNEKKDIKASDVDLSDKQLIEKEILRVGEWKHRDAPNGKLTVTQDYIQKVYNNFIEARSPVPVYRGHQPNEKAEENTDLILAKNIESLNVKDGGLFAKMKVNKDEVEKYNDVSASINPIYEDHEKGKFLGPVLNHIAFVMNPYIKGLKPFTALSESKNNFNILLSEINMEDATTQEETKTETKPEDTTIKVETQKEEVKEEVKPENTDLSDSNTIQLRLAELEKTNRELSDKINLQEAEKTYEVLLRKGKILPVMKQSFIALSQQGSQIINLSDGNKQTVSQLLINLFDSLPILVNLKEKGINLEDGDAKNAREEMLINEMKSSYMKRNPQASDTEANEYINSSIAKKAIKEELDRQKK